MCVSWKFWEAKGGKKAQSPSKAPKTTTRNALDLTEDRPNSEPKHHTGNVLSDDVAKAMMSFVEETQKKGTCLVFVLDSNFNVTVHIYMVLKTIRPL